MAGIINGAIYSLVLRNNGSTGGTDVIAALIRKRHPEASLVWLIFTLNAAVAAISYFVYDFKFEPVLLCLLYCYLSSSVSNNLMKQGQRALKFEVITEHSEALAEQLLRELHHGVTVLPAEGAFSHKKRELLICVVNRHQIVRFHEILAQFPPSLTSRTSTRRWAISQRCRWKRITRPDPPLAKAARNGIRFPSGRLCAACFSAARHTHGTGNRKGDVPMGYEDSFKGGRQQSVRKPHNITMEDRRQLAISGVEEVESFDEREIVMRTSLGTLTVSGEDLSVSRLSVETGDVDIQGRILGLEYEEETGGRRGLLGRLFR